MKNLTAKQARELANEVKQTEFQNELSHALNKICNTANGGEYKVYIHIKKSTLDEISAKLKELGYLVEGAEQLMNNGTTSLLISW